MAEVELDDAVCVSAQVLMPRVGAWTADVVVDDATPRAGRVTLAIDGARFAGAVVRGGVRDGRWRGRLVGGVGGLRGTVAAVAHRGATLGLVLADVLRATGEALAPSSADLSAAVARWGRIEGPGARTVADVARAAGCAWRVLPDGSVWVGREAWAEHRPDVDVVDWRPETGRLEVAGDVLGILPGQTLVTTEATVRVGCAEILASPDALRVVVLAEPEERPAGRLLDALQRLLAPLWRRLSYQALHPARVVAQADDGSLELVADDPDVMLPPGVPLRGGLPGVRAVVPAGARVLVTFERGDPARPVATLWELGDVTRLVVDGGTHPAAREGHATVNGEVSATMTPPAGTPPLRNLVLTYTPPGGAPQTLTLTGLPPTVEAIGSLSLAGRIDEGADAVHLP